MAEQLTLHEVQKPHQPTVAPEPKPTAVTPVFPAQFQPVIAPSFPAATAPEPAAPQVLLWLVIVGELLLMPALLCMYGVYRFRAPDVFAWGQQLLDQGWGLIGLIVLAVSSFTMVMVVRCAARRERQLLMLFLTLTLMCGIVFLGIKVIEYRQQYSEALFGISAEQAMITPPPPPVAALDATGGAAAQVADLAQGRKLYMSTCASCHGPNGEGVAQLGLPLNDSPMMIEGSIDSLADFIKAGRQPGDPASRMNALMPPRGGNPFLSDNEVQSIAVYLKSLVDSSELAAAQSAGAEVDADILIPRWILSAPEAQHLGLAAQQLRVRVAPAHPSEHASMFYGIYLSLTGLQILHLALGMAVLVWLGMRVTRGDFDHGYLKPLKLGRLYWHTAAALWLVLFPLLYLIR